MTDSTSTRFSIIREVTAGTLPASPLMQQLRFNSSNLSTSISSVTSDEIDDTRNISDLSMVGIENGGDIQVEVSPLSHDELIAGAMFNNWTKWPEVHNQIENQIITALTTSAVTVTTPNGSQFAAGDVVRLYGFSNPANNIQSVVTTATATAITLTGTPLTAQTGVIAGARVKKVGVQGASADISTSVTPNRLTSVAINWATMGVLPGDWIKIGGSLTANQFGTAANNGFCRVLSVAVGVLTFDIVPTGFAADVGTGKTIRVYLGDRIRNGTTKLSYSVEQLFTGASPQIRQMFNGLRVGTLSLNMESQSIATSSFSFMGTNSQYLDSAPAGQAYWRDTLTEVFNTSSNVGRIAENGAPISGNNCIMSATVNLDNGLRGKPCIGLIGYGDIGAGRCNITGNLNMYFGSADIAKKILSNEVSGVDFRLQGSDGSAVVWDLPRLKFSEGSTPITGIDTDVMLDASYQALKHPTLGFTLHIQRFAAIQ